jgi:hypothetical protein
MTDQQRGKIRKSTYVRSALDQGVSAIEGCPRTEREIFTKKRPQIQGIGNELRYAEVIYLTALPHCADGIGKRSGLVSHCLDNDVRARARLDLSRPAVARAVDHLICPERGARADRSMTSTAVTHAAPRCFKTWLKSSPIDP